ncbi:FadR/GntR family transcriptional regulator, partial [Streptococcus pyogenes]
LDERVAVETGAAVLAAERRTDEDLAAMAALVERMAGVESAEFEDFDEYRRADIRFHIAVAEAADSPRLVAMMTDVQGRMSDLIARI